MLVGVPAVAAGAAEPNGTISGTVYLDRGDGTLSPLDRADVGVYYYPSGGYVWSVNTDAQGRYTLSLPAMQYILLAAPSDTGLQLLVPPEYSGGARSQQDASAITVVAGQNLVADMTLDLGGQVEMWPTVTPTAGGAPERPEPMFTSYKFDRVDPATGQVLSTTYPTFYTEFDTGQDLSSPLDAGTYNVSITSTWYDDADPFHATQQIFFTGGVTGIVIRPGERTHVGEIPLQTDYHEQIPIYRFWSPVYQGHFYTADQAERDSVMATMPSLWTYEGIAYWAFDHEMPGTVPLYRFWSGQFHGHFYTADVAEKDHVIAAYQGLWAYEGIAYYVYPPSARLMNTRPVVRFWGPGVRHHFYTASATEAENVRRTLSSMWTDEGVAFWVPSR